MRKINSRIFMAHNQDTKNMNYPKYLNIRGFLIIA